MTSLRRGDRSAELIFRPLPTNGMGRLPFRVFTLTNPPRVVIDVARHW